MEGVRVPLDEPERPKKPKTRRSENILERQAGEREKEYRRNQNQVEFEEMDWFVEPVEWPDPMPDLSEVPVPPFIGWRGFIYTESGERLRVGQRHEAWDINSAYRRRMARDRLPYEWAMDDQIDYYQAYALSCFTRGFSPDEQTVFSGERRQRALEIGDGFVRGYRRLFEEWTTKHREEMRDYWVRNDTEIQQARERFMAEHEQKMIELNQRWMEHMAAV
jgi:hypothetical protein